MNTSLISLPDREDVEKKFASLIQPFQDFIRTQTSCSLLLLVALVSALSIANSPLNAQYQAILSTKLAVSLGEVSLAMDLKHWVNEGLMALFFFLLGMEIKREILVGELKEMSHLMPVLAAACGGMLFPALMYSVFNYDTNYSHGWGIVMATDTAFAIGVLILLGNKAPTAAMAFLVGLAIIDDIGAILVIALFYNDAINTQMLLYSFACLAFMATLNLCGVRKLWPFALTGLCLWLFMLGTGLHATLAGILIALAIPARPRKNAFWFIGRLRKLSVKFRKMELSKEEKDHVLSDLEQHDIVENVKKAAEDASTPLRRWENALNYPVALLILPIFALTNAGIHLEPDSFSTLLTHPLALGIVFGLVFGKSVGILLFSWLMLRFNLGKLPEGLSLAHLLGIGLLGGMGFTMSIFISNLGFAAPSLDAARELSKLAILVASFVAGTLGYLWFSYCHKQR